MDIDEASLKLHEERAGQDIGHLDYRLIARDIEEIPEAIYERIVRERRAELKEPLFLYLELLTQVSRDTWDSIKFLCKEKLDHGRRIEFAYAVPPLTRTLLDSLLSVIYIFDDREVNSRWYYAAAWRDRFTEHKRLEKKYGADSAWKTWFVASAADIDQVAKLASITDAERLDVEKPKPTLITFWPNPGKFGGQQHGTKDPKRGEFLRFVRDWFYGNLSGDSHLSFSGLVRRGGHYAALAAGADIEELHKLHRSQRVLEALSIYVALLSEISGELRFDHEKNRLRGVWGHLKPAWPDAAEFFDKRYEDWLR